MLQYPGVTLAGIPVSTTISGYPDTQCIVIYNESPYFLNINLVGSANYSLAAYTADCFEVLPGFTGGIMYNPTQYISTLQAPASIAFIQAYGANEHLTRLIKNNQPTGYPIALGRLQNLGNGSILATASSVSNENNAVGTLVYDSGDTTFNKLVQLFNDGSALWNVDQSGIKHKVVSINNSGNPLQLGQASDTTEILGNLLVDGILNFNGSGVSASPPTGTGTVTIYEFIVGNWKISRVYFNNLQNTNASQFTLALPTAYTSTVFAICGDISNTELLHSTTAQSIHALTAPNGGNNSGFTAQTVLWSGNIAWSAGSTPFETLRFQASNGVAHTGDLWLLGV